jgi:glycosyltransferase involved in cell wall biosynthesis
MKVLVLPRDPNPYQSLLYGEMQRLGAQITYIGDLTPSQTLNVLLLPLETFARRIAGARLVHVHWVFIAHIWFIVWLRTCRALGMHLVWTAHNVLPHRSVFANDVSARRALVEASDLVLAHSQSALAELAALGAVPRRSAVIQHGPIAPILPSASLKIPRAGDKPCRFLFFGQVQEYKGVDDLLAAFLAIPDEVAAHLTVAGQCDDPTLRSRIYALAQRADQRVELCLERVPEEKVARLFAAADVVVLPFRRITTSGSAILALSNGKPLVVPNLAGLADLPDQAVLRYDGGIPALIAALVYLAHADGETLAAMSAAASSYAARVTWREIAERTAAEMLTVLDSHAETDLRGRPAGVL